MVLRRDIEGSLKGRARRFPVLVVTGPRQSGKTTLCRAVFPHLPYVSLELPDVRRRVLDDPRGFLREYAEGAILDEVQNTPELLSYLQVEVDERPRPGRYILTGWSAPVGHAIAGRQGRHAGTASILAGRTARRETGQGRPLSRPMDGRLPGNSRSEDPSRRVAGQLRRDLRRARRAAVAERVGSAGIPDLSSPMRGPNRADAQPFGTGQ